MSALPEQLGLASPGKPAGIGRAMQSPTYNWNVHCNEFVPQHRPTAVVVPVHHKSFHQNCNRPPTQVSLLAILQLVTTYRVPVVIAQLILPNTASHRSVFIASTLTFWLRKTFNSVFRLNGFILNSRV